MDDYTEIQNEEIRMHKHTENRDKDIIQNTGRNTDKMVEKHKHTRKWSVCSRRRMIDLLYTMRERETLSEG